MLVSLRLSLTDAIESTNTSASFWDEYVRLSETSGPGVDRSASAATERIRTRFAERLEMYVNRSLEREIEGLPERLSIARYVATVKRTVAAVYQFRRPIGIKLLHIRYGSIELVLSMLGIDNEALKELVLEALTIYAPIAFNDVAGGNAELEASFTNPPATQATTKQPTKTLALLQASLLVPVVLALAVCYVAFEALKEEMKGLRSESQSLRLERIEIVKAITEQNVKISGSIVEAAKSAVVQAKELEQLQINLIKLRAISLGLLPPDPLLPAQASPSTAPSIPTSPPAKTP